MAPKTKIKMNTLTKNEWILDSLEAQFDVKYAGAQKDFIKSIHDHKLTIILSSIFIGCFQ